MRIEYGASRIVVLTKRFAFKFPRVHGKNFAYGQLDSLCKGIMHNIREYEFSKMNNPYLCPIVFHIRGLLNVMPKVPLLLEEDMIYFGFPDELTSHIVEEKADSWGVLNGQLVAIDYSG